jgi:chaperonin GroES|tara:strand:- start:3695 stop:4168 length:474 start_codon:yes stop_codon:yes gene_type:complete
MAKDNVTGLLIPDHIANKENIKAKKLSDSFVEPKDVVFDPSKMPQTAKDALPKPTGWRVLILPYQGKKTSKGGVFIPDEIVARETLATVCGYVLKIGPDAWKDSDKFPAGAYCKEGDWVIFGRYAGSRFKIDGGEVRLLNDDEILATITNPDDILHI